MSENSKQNDIVTEILNDAFDKEWDVFSPEEYKHQLAGTQAEVKKLTPEQETTKMHKRMNLRVQATALYRKDRHGSKATRKRYFQAFCYACDYQSHLHTLFLFSRRNGMGEWKKWMNANYAFSNNGEKIKRVTKATYTINLVLIFIAAVLGCIGFLIETFSGGFEYVWPMPFVIALTVLLAPYLIYWSLSFLYGFGELVSNSYVQETISNEKNEEECVDFEGTAEKLKSIPQVNLKTATQCECGEMFYGRYCPVCGRKAIVIQEQVTGEDLSDEKKTIKLK